MSRSKDPSSKLHEKHQTILADLLRDEDNKYCADCMAKGPRWASWNLGVFMCIRCAGIHRNLGVHVSRVKSVNLDSWTPEQIESIQRGGNKYAKEKYEANLPANFRRPQDDYAVEQFIRAKYERKLYIEKGEGGSNSSKGKELSVQEQKNKAKQKKTLSTSSTQKSAQIHVSVPRPSSARQSPSPQPLKHTLVTSSSSSSVSSSKATGADLLISLESQASKSARKTSPQPVVDLLMGLGTPTPSDASTSTSSGGSKASDPFGSMQPTGPMSNQGLFSGQGQQVQVSTTPTVGISNNKDSIMSLYGAQNQQPQLSSYTAQGYPVNAFYYQQQQEAAMRMAHMAAVQQHQVNQVTAQMQKIKMNQQPAPSQPFPSMSNGGVPSATAAGMGMGIGGQTLNPTLW